eukprot:CAMPEP_0117473338 /NCGR_PEP_ID=MMETSP0784-20121206/8722_1 /TAXON_ID=39447 /ORGANISM="" /LENGTH=156 /DNA_ID=CAMNT_0005267539 /DNA_START=792 /DNA_END=1262 /DNA_ORIENTATION=-
MTTSIDVACASPLRKSGGMAAFPEGSSPSHVARPDCFWDMRLPEATAQVLVPSTTIGGKSSFNDALVLSWSIASTCRSAMEGSAIFTFAIARSTGANRTAVSHLHVNVGVSPTTKSKSIGFWCSPALAGNALRQKCASTRCKPTVTLSAFMGRTMQ